MDPKLSPPIIKKPIYNCAKTIAFTGACGDSIIIVFVNGNPVTKANTWLGWGEIELPNPLKTGDKVSAVQVVNNEESWPTREPVDVINIPSNLVFERKLLNIPEIVPPLYECQAVVRLRNILEGATIVLKNNNGKTWSKMTPYNYIRIPTDELDSSGWYSANQMICVDEPFVSDWSKKEYMQPKPQTLPRPKVREPIILGSDGCIVDNLIPGAIVEVFSYDGIDSKLLSKGVASESSTIFRISTPFEENLKYYANQSLCEIKSNVSPEEGVSPIKDVPSPIVQGTICNGDFYITICNTIVNSTVNVYIDGLTVDVSGGNGSCVTIALGSNYVFSTGQKVTAQQFVAGKSSPISAPGSIHVSGSPPYNPTLWNNPNHLRKNNCYNYACDLMTDTFAQPGLAHEKYPYSIINCVEVGNGAIADGLKKQQSEERCAKCTHVVALFVASGDVSDYHWYRLDNNGYWSHKPGGTPATNLDASGNKITNPLTANRKYIGPDYTLDYKTFCAYYCVDNKLVVIK